MNQRLASSHFPYLPLYLRVRHATDDLEALLDTGFDGDVVVPAGIITDGHLADGYLPCRLADGSEVLAPFYRGTLALGTIASFRVVVLALGDEPLVGRGVSDRFTIILDHGRRLIVEP